MQITNKVAGARLLLPYTCAGQCIAALENAIHVVLSALLICLLISESKNFFLNAQMFDYRV